MLSDDCLLYLDVGVITFYQLFFFPNDQHPVKEAGSIFSGTFIHLSATIEFVKGEWLLLLYSQAQFPDLIVFVF